jgi:hypothetical protein
MKRVDLEQARKKSFSIHHFSFPTFNRQTRAIVGRYHHANAGKEGPTPLRLSPAISKMENEKWKMMNGN